MYESLYSVRLQLLSRVCSQSIFLEPSQFFYHGQTPFSLASLRNESYIFLQPSPVISSSTIYYYSSILITEYSTLFSITSIVLLYSVGNTVFKETFFSLSSSSRRVMIASIFSEYRSRTQAKFCEAYSFYGCFSGIWDSGVLYISFFFREKIHTSASYQYNV